MLRNFLPGFLFLIFILSSCTGSNHDPLTGKKWVTALDHPWGQEVLGQAGPSNNYLCEYRSNGTGVSEQVIPRIEWNGDTILGKQSDTFSYYRKGNSLFVKSRFDDCFREQLIRELTDSTLVVEIADDFKQVFHFTAMK